MQLLLVQRVSFRKFAWKKKTILGARDPAALNVESFDYFFHTLSFRFLLVVSVVGARISCGAACHKYVLNKAFYVPLSSLSRKDLKDPWLVEEHSQLNLIGFMWCQIYTLWLDLMVPILPLVVRSVDLAQGFDTKSRTVTILRHHVKY